jgi:hypothetical protein
LLCAHGQRRKQTVITIGCATIVDSMMAPAIAAQHYGDCSITRSYVQFFFVSLRASLWLSCSRNQMSISKHGLLPLRFSEVLREYTCKFFFLWESIWTTSMSDGTLCQILYVGMSLPNVAVQVNPIFKDTLSTSLLYTPRHA